MLETPPGTISFIFMQLIKIDFPPPLPNPSFHYNAKTGKILCAEMVTFFTKKTTKSLVIFNQETMNQNELRLDIRGQLSVTGAFNVIEKYQRQNIIVFIQLLYANRPYFHKEPG